MDTSMLIGGAIVLGVWWLYSLLSPSAKKRDFLMAEITSLSQENQILKEKLAKEQWLSKNYREGKALREEKLQAEIDNLKKKIEQNKKIPTQTPIAAKHKSFIDSKWHEVCTCPFCNGILPVNFCLYGVNGPFDLMTIRFFATCEHCKHTYEWDGLEHLMLIQERWETEIDAMFRVYGSEDKFFIACLDEFLWRFEKCATVAEYTPPPLTKTS